MTMPTMPRGPTGKTGNVTPKGYRLGQTQQFTPEQMQLFQQMFSHVGPDSFLSRLASGDESQFEQLEAPALRQLGEFQGGLASRFSGMGLGARRGSGHQLAQGQLASDFAQQLQSNRLGLQRQAIQDLAGLSQSLLGQRPYETSLIKKQMPFWKQLLLGINERGQEFAGTAAKAAMSGAF
jgi:hypothetical protein